MSISLEHAKWLFISVPMASYTSLILRMHIDLLAQLCSYCVGSEVAPLRLTCDVIAIAISILLVHRLACHYDCSRLLCSRGYNLSKSIQKIKSTWLWWHMHWHITLLYKTNSCLTIAGRSVGMKQHRSSAKRRCNKIAR